MKQPILTAFNKLIVKLITILAFLPWFCNAQATRQTAAFMRNQKVNTQLSSSAKSSSLALQLPDGYSGLHLQLSADANAFANSQTGIYFSSTWTDIYSPYDDALDLNGPGMAVTLSSFTSDGYRVSINSMSSYAKDKRIKLFVTAATSGQYNISLVDISNVDSLYHAYLVDNLLKDSVDLRTGKNYDFAVNVNDTTTFGSNRFVLAIEIAGLPPYKLLSFIGEKNGATIPLQWTTANEGTFTGFTLQKLSGTQWVGIDSLQSDGSGQYNYLDADPIQGINTYRLMQNDIIGNITYSDLVTVNTTPGAGLPPYKLLSFTGKKNGTTIPLQWTTANEGTFTAFTLQKLSGTQWVEIDSLQGNGSGQYDYLDTDPAQGINSYRLAQIDFTGKITYSDLVTVNTISGNGGLLSVYPNPTHGDININVNLAANTYKLVIYNSFGGVMKLQTINGTNWAGDVTGYNAGTYIIEMTDDRGKFVGKTKFVKVR